MNLRVIALALLPMLMVGPPALADDARPGTDDVSEALSAPTAITFDAQAELERLTPFLEDGEQAFEAVRQFDRVQQRLASWDLELAEQYALENDMELAREANQRGRTRMETVRTAYGRLLERYPDHAAAHNYLGEVQYDWLGEQGGAVILWHRARELDATLAAPRNNLAIHYSHVGEYEQCLQLFDEVMALEPDNPDYLYNLVQIFLIHPRYVEAHYGIERTEVYERAMVMSRRAAELMPKDYAVVQDYAVNFFAAQNFGVPVNWADAAAAWQSARGAVRRTDELFYTWLNEGRAWLRGARNDEAARCFREALAIIPDSAIARDLLAKAEGN